MILSDDAAFPATEDGIFIPVANTPGLLAAELEADIPAATRLGKFFYSVCKKIATYRLANTDIVGLTVTRSENVVTDRYGVKQKVFAFGIQQVSDDRDKTLYFPPVASSGTRAGLADFLFTDIFPGAVKVASGANTSGAGVLIKSSAIAAESPLTHATINLSSDSRELVRALLSAMFTARPLRSAEIASGLTQASFGNKTSAVIPSTWVQDLNPSTGLLSADTRWLSLDQRTIQFTIETIEDDDAETFDVNSIVTPA